MLAKLLTPTTIGGAIWRAALIGLTGWAVLILLGVAVYFICGVSAVNR